MNDGPTPTAAGTAQTPELKLALRIATKAQLDQITKVAQAGFPDDPEWNYRFPNRHEFPEDNWKWTRCEYEEYFDQPEKYKVITVIVDAEGARGDTENYREAKVIAIAVWDIAPLTESKGGDLGICERRDANPLHMRTFADALEKAYDKYFGQYKDKQYHLWLLTTHPEYRRRGAGTMLCKWGLEKAKEDAVVATVLSSPMGKLLYEHLGFKSRGFFVVQADDEPKKLTVYCLEHKTSEKPSAGGLGRLLPWRWWA